MSDAPTIVVSGLPRSGTSLTMQMLQAGGLPLVTDGVRTSDEDNKRGYYEFEPVKKLADAADWLEGSRGKGVKVISFLLKQLPDAHTYRVIFVERDIGEVLASQRKMLERRGEANKTDDATMREVYEKHLTETRSWLSKCPNIETIYVNYTDVLTSPEEQAKRIIALVGQDLDPTAMAACVDPALHRQKRTGPEQAGES